jgi:hypothetical protein
MQSKGITNVGQLRKFLATAMQGVADGTLELEKASQLTKLAAQVNESFYSEAKVARLRAEAGDAMPKLGQLPIE